MGMQTIIIIIILVSLCSSGLLQSRWITQTRLEFMALCLPQPYQVPELQAWITILSMCACTRTCPDTHTLYSPVCEMGQAHDWTPTGVSSLLLPYGFQDPGM